MHRGNPPFIVAFLVLAFCGCSSQKAVNPAITTKENENTVESRRIPHPQTPQKKVYKQELKVYHLDDWNPADMNKESAPEQKPVSSGAMPVKDSPDTDAKTPPALKR